MIDVAAIMRSSMEKTIETFTLTNGEEVSVVEVTPMHPHFKIVRQGGGLMATRNEYGERLIVVSSRMKEVLTPDEMEAVLAHELGHHELGHVPEFDRADSGTFVNNQWLEVEADRFAIQRTSKQALKSALGKTLCLITGLKTQRAAMVVLWLAAPRRMFHLL